MQQQSKQSINEYAKRYNTTVDFDRHFINFRFMRLKEHYPRLGDVLELGCANGLMTEKLLIMCESLDVVDGSEHYIEETKKRLGDRVNDVKFYHSLFLDFNPDKKYDAIILSSILHEADNPIELLKKCKAWIKEDGMIYINVPNATSLHRQIGKEIGLLNDLYDFNERDVEFCHQRIYDMGKFESDVKSAGWQIKKKGGFFLKTLSNSQLKKLDQKAIDALYKVSKNIPAELCAEIYIFASL